MDLKDVVTISFSGVAVIVSLVAFVVSYRRGQDEQRRAIRQQLTETTDKITESQIEFAKSAFGDARMRQSIQGVLGQRIASLLSHAVYLAGREPSLVTAVDYNTIAIVSAATGDLEMADTNYQKAIQASTSESHRTGCTRTYAMFLFSDRRFEEGRALFREVASTIRGADSRARTQKGITYEVWGWCEKNHAAAPKRADEAFESARAEFMGIDNELIRSARLEQLERAKGSLVPPTAPQPVTPLPPPRMA